MLFLLFSNLEYEKQETIETIFKDNNSHFERIAATFLHNKADAEDAVSTSYLKIIKHMDKIEAIKDKRMIKLYCSSIVKNTCLDILRKTKRNKVEDIENFSDTSASSTEEKILRMLDAERIGVLLKDFSNDENYIIFLRYFEEMSYKEIALLLDISEPAAKKRCLRVVSKIRNLLKKEDQI